MGSTKENEGEGPKNMALSKRDKLKMCIGCRDNFYNGNNSLGIKECWLLGKAKVVKKKRVSMSQRPPWTQAAIRVLNCRHEKGYVFVGPKQTC